MYGCQFDTLIVFELSTGSPGNCSEYVARFSGAWQQLDEDLTVKMFSSPPADI